MEPLAYVEIIGRGDEVQTRHPVYRWPACVGRGYNADVIIDDAYIAPLHIRIEPAEDGRFSIRDQGSVNGTMLAASGVRVSETHLGPDDVVAIGQTRLRVRPLNYAVRAETPLRAQTSWRDIGLFALLAAVVVGVVVWNAHLVTLHQDEGPVLIFGAISSIAAIALWVSAWTLLSRIVMGRGGFAAHGIIACSAMILLIIVDVVFDYLAFGLDAGGLEYAGLVAAAMIFAYAFYRHLRLARRASTRALAIAAAMVSVTLYGGAVVLEQVRDSTNHSRQRYSETVKAPVFLLAKGVTPASMLADADSLRRKVDDEARKDP